MLEVYDVDTNISQEVVTMPTCSCSLDSLSISMEWLFVSYYCDRLWLVISKIFADIKMDS